MLDRAEALLPKYGGLCSGAVNQALLLLGLRASREEHLELAAALQARVAA